MCRALNRGKSSFALVEVPRLLWEAEGEDTGEIWIHPARISTETCHICTDDLPREFCILICLCSFSSSLMFGGGHQTAACCPCPYNSEAVSITAQFLFTARGKYIVCAQSQADAGLQLNEFRLIPLIHRAAELGRSNVKQCRRWR